ncbi:MAG TPA: sigma-70 family RNA polymerase sigma factor [Pseudonocardiaceae bacterium]|nr:sigma-70 family RNA polymerase sigma factor [Pseudonocardiaceae bacterium]
MPATACMASCAESDETSDIATLLRVAMEGDSRAWTEIVLRYGRLVAATVHSFQLQDADALDAIQMTWLRLLTKGRRIQDPDKLTAWLITTARRECLAILRRSKRVAYREDIADTPADSAGWPEQRFLASEEVSAVRGLVAELPVRGRTVLWALFAEPGRPYSEIAAAIGIPIGSLGPTRARALRQLRQRLCERGLV